MNQPRTNLDNRSDSAGFRANGVNVRYFIASSVVVAVHATVDHHIPSNGVVMVFMKLTTGIGNCPIVKLHVYSICPTIWKRVSELILINGGFDIARFWVDDRNASTVKRKNRYERKMPPL